jgi:tRNA-specific 2-thiouridylase
VPARLTATGATAAELVLEAAAPTGVAPGQAGVVYDGDRVLGGGWIRRRRPASDARLGPVERA